jgi:hypothetical protein
MDATSLEASDHQSFQVEDPMRFRTRRADIPQQDRDLFDLCGETVIQLVLAGGFQPQAPQLQNFANPPGRVQNATLWLRERRDEHEVRETRLEIVEWGVLIFVVVGVVFDGLLLARDWASKPPSAIMDTRPVSPPHPIQPSSPEPTPQAAPKS